MYLYTGYLFAGIDPAKLDAENRPVTLARITEIVEFSLLMAASTLVVLPIVAIFHFFQRFFVESPECVILSG